MSRTALIPFIVTLLASANPILAQDIASMFKERSHDFGVVARAANSNHVFEFVNTSDRDIRLQSVRTSCSCTTPEILTPVVKPGETGKINAQFNTTSFLGDRSASLTLTIDSPYWTQVQLQVKGYVRRDIVVQPGKVDFGVVNVGQETSKTVTIKYAGSSHWKIDKVTCENPSLVPSLKQVKNENGRIDYELNVQLSDVTKPGYMNDELVLHTNDQNRREFPISVSGRIQSAIESPSVIFLGDVEKGQSVKKSVILKGDREFKVTGIEFSDKRVEIPQPDTSKKLHTLIMSFNASQEGEINDEIVIHTDHPVSETTKFRIMGTVK
jgi:hypothetical protein